MTSAGGLVGLHVRALSSWRLGVQDGPEGRRLRPGSGPERFEAGRAEVNEAAVAF